MALAEDQNQLVTSSAPARTSARLIVTPRPTTSVPWPNDAGILRVFLFRTRSACAVLSVRSARTTSANEERRTWTTVALVRADSVRCPDAELRHIPDGHQIQQVRVACPCLVRARSRLRPAGRAVDRARAEPGEGPARVMTCPGPVGYRAAPHPAPRQPPHVCGDDGPARPLEPGQLARDREAGSGLHDDPRGDLLAPAQVYIPADPQGEQRIAGEHRQAFLAGPLALVGALIQADVAPRMPAGPARPQVTAPQAPVNLDRHATGPVLRQLRLLPHQLVAPKTMAMPGRIRPAPHCTTARQRLGAVRADTHCGLRPPACRARLPQRQPEHGHLSCPRHDAHESTPPPAAARRIREQRMHRTTGSLPAPRAAADHPTKRPYSIANTRTATPPTSPTAATR